MMLWKSCFVLLEILVLVMAKIEVVKGGLGKMRVEGRGGKSDVWSFRIEVTDVVGKSHFTRFF